MRRSSILVPLVALALSSSASAAPRPLLTAGSLPGTVFAGTPEVAARAALAATGAVRLSPGSTLQLVGVHAAANGHVVRFEQRHRGLRVHDAIVTVRLDAAGHVKRILSSAVELGEVATRPVLSANEAVKVGRKATPIVQPRQDGGRATLVVTRSGQLAWDVRVPALLPHQAAIVATVDAVTGEVLSVVDHAKHANANVFESAKAAQEARQEDSTFAANATKRVTLKGLVNPAPGAALNLQTDTTAGILAYNCCANAGCDGTSQPKFRQGTLPVQGITVSFTTVLCDELQTAFADQNGDYLYTPPREPRGLDSGGVDIDPVPSASDSDTFAEVHAYNAAQEMLEYMKVLDPEFQLRAEARPLRITANFTLPKFSEALDNFDLETFTTTVRSLQRLDNAAYVPAGSNEGVGIAIPEFEREFDSILMFQGTRSDFAYDRDVVAHEFSHGTIGSTAGLADYAADAQGIVDAPGAMNEGLADFWAAALANDGVIGEYAGDLTGNGEGSIRDLSNSLACPSVLKNEVHQDSQHFSAALWTIRTSLATTAEKKLTFDRAMLTAMRGMSPISTFDEAAEVIADELATAFSTTANARATIDAEFAGRGITGCERVLDLAPGASVKGLTLAPTNSARGWRNVAPGPLQFKLELPPGATSVRFVALGSAGGGLGGIDLPFEIPGGGGNDNPNLKVFLKQDESVKFAYGARTVSDDATLDGEFTASGGGDPVISIPMTAGCGETWYAALGNTGGAAFSLEELKVTFAVDASKAKLCEPVVVDAGPLPDAGGSGGDAPVGGCGCGGGAGSFVLLGLVAVRRKRRN